MGSDTGGGRKGGCSLAPGCGGAGWAHPLALTSETDMTNGAIAAVRARSDGLTFGTVFPMLARRGALRRERYLTLPSGLQRRTPWVRRNLALCG